MRLELEGEMLRQLGGIHAPALYDTPVLDDGRPCVVMEFVPMPTAGRPAGASWRTACRSTSSGGAALSLLDGAGGRARARAGPPRSQAREHLLDRLPAGDAHLRLRPGQDRPPGTPQQDTTVGIFMGTPEYMAPEQLDSSAPVDQRADIYAIGAVLLRDAGRAGRRSGATPPRCSRRWRTGARPAPRATSPGAPPALEDVILRCLAKDPVRRFATTDGARRPPSRRR